MGNMSALDNSVSDPLEDTNSSVAVTDLKESNNSPAVPDPKESITFLGEQPEPAEKSLIVKSKKLRSYRQKVQALQARIKYREKAIKGIQQHLKRGTFPKRFKSLKPYPKMDSLDTQAIVNAACQQVECLILDQMILDEEKKLTQEQFEYQVLKKERGGERTQRVKPVTKPKKLSMAQLRLELTDLQSKYAQLCQQLNNVQ